MRKFTILITLVIVINLTCTIVWLYLYSYSTQSLHMITNKIADTVVHVLQNEYPNELYRLWDNTINPQDMERIRSILDAFRRSLGLEFIFIYTVTDETSGRVRYIVDGDSLAYPHTIRFGQPGVFSVEQKRLLGYAYKHGILTTESGKVREICGLAKFSSEKSIYLGIDIGEHNKDYAIVAPTFIVLCFLIPINLCLMVMTLITLYWYRSDRTHARQGVEKLEIYFENLATRIHDIPYIRGEDDGDY